MIVDNGMLEKWKKEGCSQFLPRRTVRKGGLGDFSNISRAQQPRHCTIGRIHREYQLPGSWTRHDEIFILFFNGGE